MRDCDGTILTPAQAHTVYPSNTQRPRPRILPPTFCFDSFRRYLSFASTNSITLLQLRIITASNFVLRQANNIRQVLSNKILIYMYTTCDQGAQQEELGI